MVLLLHYNMPKENLRIILMGKDIELRIISLIVRSQEISENVVYFDLGSSDSTVSLAKDFGCQILEYNLEPFAPELSKFIADSFDDDFSSLVISIHDDWKLNELPVIINRANESWDVYFSFINDALAVREDTNELVLGSLQIDYLFLSRKGLIELANCSSMSSSSEFSSDYKVRIIESQKQIKIPQRESLATASKFAQLFYWMLETKHPLFLFGVPGIVLFILGYRLSGNVVDTFSEFNSVSIGVTLTTIAMTLVGLFAMMVALILYIMGKQVEQIQAQYNWEKRE